VLFVGEMIGIGAEPQEQPKGTTVTCRVVSEAGGPGVAGVDITLWNGFNGHTQKSRTDDKGDYSFTLVESGNYYKIWVWERPKAVAGIWSEGVLVRLQDRPVRADDLFLKLPQSVVGTVTDIDSGRPGHIWSRPHDHPSTNLPSLSFGSLFAKAYSSAAGRNARRVRRVHRGQGANSKLVPNCPRDGQRHCECDRRRVPSRCALHM
jgi:hypothetical protein